MKMREIVTMGFKPMIDKKGRTVLVMPLLELNPELAVEMGKEQIQTALRHAYNELEQEVHGVRTPAPVAP